MWRDLVACLMQARLVAPRPASTAQEVRKEAIVSEPQAARRQYFWYLVAARALTLARLVSIAPFLLLFMHTSPAAPLPWRLSLLLLYVCIALSDVFDGRCARKAGAASHVWGQLDATADIAFTTSSLTAAAWLGWVGPWVPAGIALLGGRFLLRNLRPQPAPSRRLIEDRAGKAAGVIYYLLVGAIVGTQTLLGEDGRWLLARAGDLVFLYTLFLLLRRPKRLNPSVP